MINISLKQLRYFEALARHEHFGRAAEACSISQPALSLQIKELEETIGVSLVERGARSARLTPLGETFMHRARDILLAVEELGDLARASSETLGGRLRVGMIPTIAPYLFPQAIRAMRNAYPRAEFVPREARTETLLMELKSGSLDLAIMALPISDPALHEETLFDEEFMLVRPKSQADNPLPTRENFREMILLLLEEGHCFRDQALSFCNIPTSGNQAMMEGSSLSTLVQMVGAEIGVSLIPEMAVPIETRSADVCVSRFASPRPHRTVGAIWRKANPLTEHFVKISKIIAQANEDRPAIDL